jgi:hypothetical protein
MGELAPERALALGRRMSACAVRSRLKGWPNGLRFLGVDEDGEPDGRDGIVVPGGYLEDDQVRDNYERQLCGRVAVENPPDLRDPATAGLLPMLVREVLGLPRISARWNAFRRQWEVEPIDLLERDYRRLKLDAGRSTLGTGPTEAEAWLAAWESV